MRDMIWNDSESSHSNLFWYQLIEMRLVECKRLIDLSITIGQNYGKNEPLDHLYVTFSSAG